MCTLVGADAYRSAHPSGTGGPRPGWRSSGRIASRWRAGRRHASGHGSKEAAFRVAQGGSRQARRPAAEQYVQCAHAQAGRGAGVGSSAGTGSSAGAIRSGAAAIRGAGTGSSAGGAWGVPAVGQAGAGVVPGAEVAWRSEALGMAEVVRRKGGERAVAFVASTADAGKVARTSHIRTAPASVTLPCVHAR